MQLTAIGVDLAKCSIQVHGVDQHGKVRVRKALRREQVLEFFALIKPCVIGMEACGGAHYWARKFSELGHTVRLMAPQFVKPYVKTNKNDAADAEAVCEALLRPSMRFVPVKTPEQQSVLALHRARQGFVKARTAQANQIRGLLAEFGIVLPQGIGHIGKRMAKILEDETLPGRLRGLMQRLTQNLAEMDRQVQELEHEIKQWHRQSEASRRLEAIPGIGPITASALAASVGDARCFRSARQLAAWLGLVPRQHSTGGRQVLLGISKRGDAYLRTLLIHGARAVVRVAQRRPAAHTWLTCVMGRRNPNVAAVALANKNARIAWALLRHERTYTPGHGETLAKPT